MGEIKSIIKYQTTDGVLDTLQGSNVILKLNMSQTCFGVWDMIKAQNSWTNVYPLSYYKLSKPQGEQDKQYWKEIAIAFLEQKHNTNITRKGFSIEIYTGWPPYEPYFITLTLQGQIIIGLTKKLVTTHVVGDLVLLD